MICKMFTKVLMNTMWARKRKILVAFDDMIADMINNKKLNSIVIELFIIVIELFIRDRKLNISIFLLHNPN